MDNFFINERVQLNFVHPYLGKASGIVKDERYYPPFGRCYVVEFNVSGQRSWAYVNPNDLVSLEANPVQSPATYRALSLWQPWASLVAWGEKNYETRHWKTDYRGLLAIHAAKRQPTRADVANMEWYKVARKHTYLNPEFYLFREIPRGMVLCIVNLVDVVRVETVRDSISPQERSFGNYADDRYAWKMELVEVFEQPIPAKGGQGFWNWNRAS